MESEAGRLTQKLEVRSKSDQNQVEPERHEVNTALLKLEWVAENARKVSRIKRQLVDGSYSVSSTDVAKAILDLE